MPESIVRDACARITERIGQPEWNQWQEAAEALGLRVVVSEDGPAAPVLMNDVIMVRPGLEAPVLAYLVWQEIAYAVLDAGCMRAMVQYLASEFAETFPVWE